MDVSRVLGQYMLQGWVLTDEICPRCDATPLMRAPRGRPVESFCAHCDGGPNGSEQKSSGQAAVNDASSASPSSSLSLSRSKHSVSGISTPPTDVASLPQEEDEFVLPPPSEEMLRRRAQSDLASAEIGRRLLQGWAMLADECPNHTCYGVPLLRPPKRLSDGAPSNNKECVVCHNVYSEVRDPSGVLRLQSQNMAQERSQAEPAQTVAVETPNVARTSGSLPHPNPSTVLQHPPLVTSSPPPPPRNGMSPSSATTTTLEALEKSMVALSQELQVVSSAASYLNVPRITELAHGISAVADALERTRRLGH